MPIFPTIPIYAVTSTLAPETANTSESWKEGGGADGDRATGNRNFKGLCFK